MSEETIYLTDGEDPPAGLINPDYKQQPRNSRKCVECGKTHDTIVEDNRTGERLKEIDKCKYCLLKNCFIQWIRTDACITSDGRNIKMTDVINILENELLNEE